MGRISRHIPPPEAILAPGSQRSDHVARSNEDDDPVLVERTLAGDRASFGDLVERYAAEARRVAMAVLGDPDEADDAAQDAFLAALRGLARFDLRRPFAPWLMRIVVNTATSRLRRIAVRRAFALDETIPGEEESPDRHSERGELAHDLASALVRLTPRQRIAVVLFDVEGYSHAEIATILAVREGTVRSDVFHARRALRAHLAAWRAT